MFLEGDVSLPRKFVNFSNYVGMLVAGFEKEINSLLKNLEARKGRGVKVLGGRRKHFLTSHFERELLKLEYLINYDSSPCTFRWKEEAPLGTLF